MASRSWACSESSRLSYDLLGLQSFFTVGEDEVRAWTVRRGATALEAAGTIHSDLQKGFIRAEVIGYDDLVALGGLSEARARGRLRLEGKEYLVQDGEIVHVRFSLVTTEYEVRRTGELRSHESASHLALTKRKPI